MSVWIQGQTIFWLLLCKLRVYLPQRCLLHRRPLGLEDMHGLVVGVYSGFGSVSLTVHSSSVEVDEHFDSEVVGMAAVAVSFMVSIH